MGTGDTKDVPADEQPGVDRATADMSEGDGTSQESAHLASGHDDAEPTTTRQPARAENEDDDGYDPFSDYHDRRDEPPLFEIDPWQ